MPHSSLYVCVEVHATFIVASNKLGKYTQMAWNKPLELDFERPIQVQISVLKYHEDKTTETY
jgi:hypothetical protein